MKRAIDFIFIFTFFAYITGAVYIEDLLRVCAATGTLGVFFGKIDIAEIWLVKGFRELSEVIAGRQRRPVTCAGWLALGSCFWLLSAFLLLPLLRHWGFRSWLWDLGVVEQVIWRGAQGFGLTSTAIWDKASPTLRFFNNGHLNFWLFPTSWIYAVIPRTELLLLLQSLALLSAMIPLWKIGKILFPPWVSPILLLVLYWCWDPIHRANVWDIHEVAFLPVITLWSYYFFLEGRWWLAGLFLVAAGMFKEDAWLVTGAMGFYFFAARKKWGSASLVFIAGFSVYVVYGVFFNKVNSLSDRYSYLGSHFTETIPLILHNPFVFLQELIKPVSLKFLGKLILSGGGLWLLSGSAIIPIIPTFLECALSSNANMPSFNSHYVVALGGPLLFATAVGISRLPEIFKKKETAKIFLTVAALVGVTQLYLGEPQDIREVMSSENWSRRGCLSALAGEVPSGAPLYVTDPFAAHLSKRKILLAYRKDKTFDYPGAWIVMPATDPLPAGFQEVKAACGYRVADRQVIF